MIPNQHESFYLEELEKKNEKQEELFDELLQKGEQRLDTVLRPRPAGVYLSRDQAQKGKASTGHYRRNIHSMRQGLHGRIDDGKVIYGAWLEGTGSRNATTRFKGYGSFRKVRQWLENQKLSVLKKHMRKAVLRLRGT